ncbi:aldo/keto reductase [Streptomyces sp. TRM72054]|uniref:aldo/keto reductase n=1 Tax=Streptomyces sp. TRM72054 TaxID=2870562 RepID=UPI001C8C21DB|nr:aldo/keto reductase [Streptomyces sp. TRM72054]MBX9394396.1 aldo/keto reductase [Streptomyces sp. TRM72054]
MNETTAPLVRLNSGTAMPKIGLGTYQIADAEVADVIRQAARLGYRLIDTAASYGNERGVGLGVRSAGAPREDFFVVSKVRGADHGYGPTMRALEASLDRMRLDYLDLLLIHWPLPGQGFYVDTWRAMARLRADGRVKSIGVSNFTPAHLDRLEAETGIVPAVNQIQLNPRITQDQGRTYAAEKGIVVQSWGPLSHGASLLAEPVIRNLAERHGKTPGQIVLRWHLDLDLVPLPKTVHTQRLATNIDVFDFRLSSAEHAQIAQLAGTQIPMDPDIHHEY